MILPTLLLSCTSPKVGPPPKGVDGATADTGPADTGPRPAGGPEGRVLVPPSVRILASEDFDLSIGLHIALVPAHGADPGVIIVSTGQQEPIADDSPYWTTGGYFFTPVVVLPGVLPSGDHTLASVWDGASMLEDYPWDNVLSAGDVDGDGHLDLWWGAELIRGPLLKGREMPLPEDVLATIEGSEFAVAGDFDADGDGELDVITQVGRSQQAFLRYGPLSGSIPSAIDGVADPASYSSFGEHLGCQALGTSEWLRDHLGPGRDAVALGADNHLCTYDMYFWDPFVPRGTHLRYDDSLGLLYHFGNTAIFGEYYVHDAGDVDRDGNPDVVWEVNGNGQIIPGPVSGVYDFYQDLGFDKQMLNGEVTRTVGDVTGDGAPELLAKWQIPDPSDGVGSIFQVWMLMCSPFTLPMDFSQGLPLIEATVSYIGLNTADLDGDGLHDLVDSRAQFEATLAAEGQTADEIESGSMTIWYGKDLAAACAAPPGTY